MASSSGVAGRPVGSVAPAWLAHARRLLRARGGLSVIEFAIAAPVVIVLLMALFEVGFLMTGGIFLEAGARAAGRYGITGAAVPGETRETTIRQIVTSFVCPRSLDSTSSTVCFWTTDSLGTGDLHDGSPLQIDTLAYRDPRNVGQPEPFSDLPPENGAYDVGEEYTDVNGNGQWDADMGSTDAGGSGDVVMYRVEMPQRLITPLIRTAVGTSVYWHRTSIIVRNEPF